MARVFLLPINETEKQGSYPLQYESTKRSVMGKRKTEYKNKDEQSISNYTNNIITGLAISLNNNKHTKDCFLLIF
jgi:hypothetical protein